MSTILDDVVDRAPLDGHDGRSGASLERVRLGDGRELVVKRMRADGDITMRLFGETTAREYALWRSGVLDALPPGVGHPVVDGWEEDDETVLVMRDLGSSVRAWADPVSRAENDRLMEAFALMHNAFRDREVSGLCPLVDRVRLLSPATVAPEAVASDSPIPPLVLRGWSRFPEVVPDEVGAAVRAVHDDPEPFARLLAARPSTLVHADAAHVNVGFEASQVTLLDWALATWAPPALELVPYLTASASAVDATKDEIVESFRVATGPGDDEDAVRLALFFGLVELGWNKALDITESDDAAVVARERADLDWWIAEARRTLDAGLLDGVVR